ncbi:single-stranded-DNA-specific exonuclease RecJ [Tissierella pigra]|uniref:Single-stranded-DNA-specific exonuclease RecJ n=1 Tax=Tissierella pigra TaxID=2607614 RepID=A0A6N7XJR7_9FIRM|nr:single-stranded-DNA-specific exonuclease RecJ [Tissierella pigra]MBU5426429.1 single-stranded-DNA-specific exonuclease RecJ [Tissierella pigra]MSU02309.1 single-stranded-DNA-specific exonuclease RecJ [Tissierella pigra]
MEKWFIRNKSADYKKIAAHFKISEFLAKLLINRDVNDHRLIDSFIYSNLDKLHNPKTMKDLSKGANIIKEKIINKDAIRIVGDYDVDGVISIYLLYTVIKQFGGNVDYVIPNRIDDGYGINNEIVREAKKQGIDTIITCDNGIAAIEQIKLAKELSLTVIVTDHHDLPFIIDESGEKVYLTLEADAVINPKQPDCDYAFEKLCGAAVVLKLIQELYLLFNIPLESTYDLLEYTAIATVCDVVDLVDENRIIAKKGLELINETKNIGLKALIKESGIENKEIGIYHIGFIIGPSINASGRLDSALKSLELLLCEEEELAHTLAKELREINEERKQMTIEGVERIVNTIEYSNLKDNKVLVIYEPKVHESIAGIIAGRIKDRYNRPTIVLTNGKEGVKGSGRSIEGYNMFEELSECKELLSRFGGHPMAAGLSLEYENIHILREKLNHNIKLTEEDLIPKVYIDMHLPLEYINFALINELKLLEPFGKGNNKPIFGEKDLKINRGFRLGVNKNVLKLILENKNKSVVEAIYFGDIDDFEDLIVTRYGRTQLENIYKGIDNNINIDILYYPSINEYNGKTNIQITIQSYRIS